MKAPQDPVVAVPNAREWRGRSPYDEIICLLDVTRPFNLAGIDPVLADVPGLLWVLRQPAPEAFQAEGVRRRRARANGHALRPRLGRRTSAATVWISC
jgi:hypothetical protein